MSLSQEHRGDLEGFEAGDENEYVCISEDLSAVVQEWVTEALG